MLGQQRDFILQERAEELEIAIGRQQEEPGGVDIANVVGHETIASSPDDLLTLANREAMLEVQIIRVEFFDEACGNAAKGAIPVQLDDKI